MPDDDQSGNAAALGDYKSASKLLPLIYDELRNLASAKLAREKPWQTLDATALVHEAYVRLAGTERFADRQHFFRVAAEAMRRILIDRARKKLREIHGGHHHRVPLSDVNVAAEMQPDQLIALNDALDRFAIVDPKKAELVQLRFFVGRGEAETAAALGISRATASRYWTFARAWLINSIDAAKTEV